MCLPTRLALTDSLRNFEVPNHLHRQIRRTKLKQWSTQRKPGIVTRQQASCNAHKLAISFCGSRIDHSGRMTVYPEGTQLATLARQPRTNVRFSYNFPPRFGSNSEGTVGPPTASREGFDCLIGMFVSCFSQPLRFCQQKHKLPQGQSSLHTVTFIVTVITSQGHAAAYSARVL